MSRYMRDFSWIAWTRVTYADKKFSTVITCRLLNVLGPPRTITRSANKEAATTISAENVQKRAYHLLSSHTDSLYCELAPAHVKKVL